MKWLKRTVISIFIITILFFAFYKPKGINLEGDWDAKEIILDGGKIYPDTSLSKLIHIAPKKVIINGWSKTITIPTNTNNITAKLQYTDKVKSHYKVKLFSTEKTLNGNFDVIVDTLDYTPQSYTVDVKLKSNKTLIHIQKHVIIPPWKPELPKRGAI